MQMVVMWGCDGVNYGDSAAGCETNSVWCLYSSSFHVLAIRVRVD